MNTSRRLRSVPSAPHAAPGHGLLFCAVCQVSIASAELEGGVARRTPRGRTFCGVCAKSTPEERVRRREALEAEFADDAPALVPFTRVDGAARPPAPVVPPPLPRSVDDEVLERRVGELERSAFRMQARVTRIEERLDEIARRLG